MALTEDGSVLAWGDNSSGQLNVLPDATIGVTAIAGGGSHSLAIKNEGVLAWGANYLEQCTVPAGALNGVVAIAGGGYHSLGLKTDGSVIGWGYDRYGQSTIPVLAQSDVSAIAAGWMHSVALKKDGSVIAWGDNNSGQATVPVAALSGVKAVAAGSSHTVALKNDGSVIAWGDNSDGQTNIPAAALSGVKAIAAGAWHTLALKEDGSVIAWGSSGYEQTIVPLAAKAGVIAIAGGRGHSVALVSPTAPVIVYQPFDASAFAGSSAGFSVGVSGYPLDYQWRFNGTNISGATRSALVLDGLSVTQAGGYSVVITNSVGSVTSIVANLAVNCIAPWGTLVVSSGESPTVVGSQVVLCANVEGAPAPGLQWYLNGNNLRDRTNYCLWLDNLQTNQSGIYTLVASNLVGTFTSSPVVLTVIEPVPVRAVFAGALPPLMVGSYQTLYARLSFYEPAIFQWRLNETNIAGATSQYVNLFPVRESDVGEYSVVATTSSANYTSPPISLTVYYQAPYRAWPGVASGETDALVGSDLSLLAVYEGSPCAIQWRYNGVALPSQTNNYLSLLSLTTNQAGQYSFTATNVAGMTTSSVLTLTVKYQAPFFMATPSSQTVVEGGTARFQAYAPAGPPAVYFLERNGTNVPVPLSFQGYLSAGQAAGGFSLLDTSSSDAGDYRIIASNLLGSVTSAVATLTVTPAGPLDRWTQRNPLPQSQTILSLAHGTNRFIAVGDRGTILTSGDGYNWAPQTRRADVALSGVAYGSGLFVAVGNGGTILSSSDGTNWAYRYTAPDTTLNAVTYANGRFVAVGGSASFSMLVLHSGDGVNWERIALNGFAAERCVTYGNGLFVAAGSSSIMTSPDATNWVAAYSPAREIEAIAYANGRFVGVGNDGIVLFSLDGTAWTPRAPLTTRRLLAVTYGAGRFVAAGARGTMLTSMDGMTWTAVASGTPDRLEAMGFSGETFVAAGENGTTIASSSGTNWAKQNFGITRDLDGMHLAHGTIVAVGKGGSILTSTNGAQFTQQNAGVTNDLHGVTWGGGIWVAVGEPGIVLTSSNAVNWVKRATGTTSSLKGAVCSASQWIAVGTAGTILRSTDGTTWTATTTDPAYDLNAVAYGDGVFLVAGDGYNNKNGSVYRSTDGVTWTPLAFYGGRNLRGATFINGRFYFPANDGMVFYTAAGTPGPFWSFSAAAYVPIDGGLYGPGNLRALSYSDGLWSIVGNYGLIFTSFDGIVWTQRPSRTFENLHEVVCLNGKLVAIGNRGSILQSARFNTEFEPPSFAPGLGLQLPFNGIVNCLYDLQVTSDLVNWIHLTTFTNLTESSVLFDPDARRDQQRFYRLIQK